MPADADWPEVPGLVSAPQYTWYLLPQASVKSPMSPLPELVGSEHDSVVNDGGFGALVHVPVDAVAELVDDRELLELETAELDMADELLVTADELRTADDELDTANKLEEAVGELDAATELLGETADELDAPAEDELLARADEVEGAAEELTTADDELLRAIDELELTTVEDELLGTTDELEAAAEEELDTTGELLGTTELALELVLTTTDETVELETTATLFAAKLVLGAYWSAVGFVAVLK